MVSEQAPKITRIAHAFSTDLASSFDLSHSPPSPRLPLNSASPTFPNIYSLSLGFNNSMGTDRPIPLHIRRYPRRSTACHLTLRLGLDAGRVHHDTHFTAEG